MTMTLPDELVERLESAARHENVSPQALIERWLAEHEHKITSPEPGSFAALAQSAIEANIGGDAARHTVENSREILQSEYADYLKSRMQNDNDIPTD